MKSMIVLMGGQGVGKGTFSKMLRERHDYNYVEPGAIFRALPADNPIAKLIAKGNLVSDEEVCGLMSEKFTDNQDILVDGFPRRLSQAQWLVQNYADKFAIHVLYLNVPEEIMIARINKRIREGGGRADDADAAAIRRRLDTFWNTTMPAIEWLRTAPGIKFSDVDVTGPVDENFARILAALEPTKA